MPSKNSEKMRKERKRQRQRKEDIPQSRAAGASQEQNML